MGERQTEVQTRGMRAQADRAVRRREARTPPILDLILSINLESHPREDEDPRRKAQRPVALRTNFGDKSQGDSFFRLIRDASIRGETATFGQ